MTGTSARRAAALLLALLPAARPARPALDGQIESTQQDLKKIRRELSQKERERRDADRKAKELSEEVGRISRELQSARRSLKDLESRLGETEKRRTAAEEKLWASRLGIDQWGDLLSQELKRYYQRRSAAGAGLFVELAYRKAVMADKTDGLKSALESHAKAETARDELVDLESELQRLRSRRKDEEDRVRSAQRQIGSLYQTVQGRRAVLERDIRDLNASAKEFEGLIQGLIARQLAAEAARAKREAEAAAKARKTVSAPPQAPARKKGKLPWPIEGTVVERYGKSKHPELDTYVFSNGVKLRPAKAGPVRCVDKGEVLFAGVFMNYGLMALVAHPGNLHSIYAHLGRLDVDRGQKLSVGQAIGSSGLDPEGRALVYFELRSAGVAVDPLSWLQ